VFWKRLRYYENCRHSENSLIPYQQITNTEMPEPEHVSPLLPNGNDAPPAAKIHLPAEETSAAAEPVQNADSGSLVAELQAVLNKYKDTPTVDKAVIKELVDEVKSVQNQLRIIRAKLNELLL
jgi:hypothetical protein